MANELTLSASFSFDKSGGDSFDERVSELTVTVTGGNAIRHVQSVGTSEEAIVLGDVTPGGWCFVENLDATNFVEIRSGTGATDLIRLKAGEFALFRMSADASAPYAIADSSSCDVLFLLMED
jgi:hypothetical protein